MSDGALDGLVDEAAPAAGLHHAIVRRSTLWKDVLMRLFMPATSTSYTQLVVCRSRSISTASCGRGSVIRARYQRTRCDRPLVCKSIGSVAPLAPAADFENRPRCIGSCVRKQPQHALRDFVRRSSPLHRYAGI